jgi:hypothetical protein
VAYIVRLLISEVTYGQAGGRPLTISAISVHFLHFVQIRLNFKSSERFVHTCVLSLCTEAGDENEGIDHQSVPITSDSPCG